MAVNAQAEAHEVGRINNYTGRINDPYGSHDHPNEQAAVTQRRALELAEIERDPNARHAIINQETMDGRLLGQVVAERRGIRGLWTQMVESNIGRRVGLSTLGRVATSAAGGMVVRAGLTAAVGTISHPLQAGLVGGITGTFTGYLRGRDQEEGAETWLAELRILLERHGDIEHGEDEELYTALGIMANAIKDGRVRGKADAKMEMANKIRHIEDILARRHQEARASGQPMSPIMAKINTTLAGAALEASNITLMAREDLKETYEKIIALKKRKELMTTLKGAAIGFVFGAALGKAFDMAGDFLQTPAGHEWLQQHPWLQSAAEKLHLVSGATGHEHGAMQDHMQARMEELRNTQPLAHDISVHDANYQAMDAYANDMGHVQPPAQFTTPEGPDSPMAHFSRLHNPLASLDHTRGFLSGGLDHFNDLLRQGNLHDLMQHANSNNIDLNAFAGNGQTLGQLLSTHQDAFLNLPPDVQNFVLSHPSVAPEFLTVQNGMPAFLGPLGERVGSALGMAGIGIPDAALGVGAVTGGVVMLSASAAKRRQAERLHGIYTERRQAGIVENAASNNEIFNSNSNRSKELLLNAQVQFTHLPAGYQLPVVNGVTRPPIFTITGTDRNGRLRFAMTALDEEAWRQVPPVNPHPVINQSDILNHDGTINENEIMVMPAGANQAGEAVRNRRTETRNQSIQHLTGARVTFTAYPGREFIVDVVQNDGSLIMHQPGPNVPNMPPVPNININTLLNQDNALDRAHVQILRLAGRGPEIITPDPVDLTEAQQLVGNVHQVNIQVLAGRAFIPAGQLNNNANIIIDNAFLRALRNGNYPVTIAPTNAKAAGREPALDAGIVLNRFGADFQLREHFNSGNSNQKRAFIGQMDNLQQVGQQDNLVIYDPSSQLFYRFHDMVQAQNQGNQGNQNQNQQNNIYNFTREGNNTLIPFSRANLENMEIYSFTIA